MPGTFICNFCSVEFNDESQYDRHRQSHIYVADTYTSQSDSLINVDMEQAETQIHEQSSRNMGSNINEAENGTTNFDNNSSTWDPSSPNARPLNRMMEDQDSNSSSEGETYYYDPMADSLRSERRGPGRPRGIGRGRKLPQIGRDLGGSGGLVLGDRFFTTPSEHTTQRLHRATARPVTFKHFSAGMLSTTSSQANPEDSYDTTDSKSLSPPPKKRQQPDDMTVTERQTQPPTSGTTNSDSEDDNPTIHYYNPPKSGYNGMSVETDPPLATAPNKYLSMRPPIHRKRKETDKSSTNQIPVKQRKRFPGEIGMMTPELNPYKSLRMSKAALSGIPTLQKRMEQLLSDSWVHLLRSENLLDQDTKKMSMEHKNWNKKFTARYTTTLQQIENDGKLVSRAIGPQDYTLRMAEKEAVLQVDGLLNTLVKARELDDTIIPNYQTEQTINKAIPAYPRYYDFTSLGTLIGPPQPLLQDDQTKNKKASAEEIDRYVLQLRHLNVSDIAKGHKIDSEGYFLLGKSKKV